MNNKFLWFITTLSLFLIVVIDGAFIKGKNVPRVGRSNEGDGFYDHEMGYVIKTIPSKNIPRMGRRNYDSENHYDIPKLSGLQFENLGGVIDDRNTRGFDNLNNRQLEVFYDGDLENIQN